MRYDKFFQRHKGRLFFRQDSQQSEHKKLKRLTLSFPPNEIHSTYLKQRKSVISDILYWNKLNKREEGITETAQTDQIWTLHSRAQKNLRRWKLQLLRELRFSSFCDEKFIPSWLGMIKKMEGNCASYSHVHDTKIEAWEWWRKWTVRQLELTWFEAPELVFWANYSIIINKNVTTSLYDVRNLRQRRKTAN